MAILRILAGPKAFKQVRKQGLSPDDVSAVFGASGAAKWLAIQGLDKAIFGRWIRHRNTPLHLVGTSIGAWKLAAAACNEPEQAMDKLAQAYIAQRYTNKIRPEDVAVEAERILDAYLSTQDVASILQSTSIHLHIGAVRSKGALKRTRQSLLALSMLQLALLNVRGRNALTRHLDRALFSTAPEHFPLAQGDGYPTHLLSLNDANFRQALIASGSIPYVLPAVKDIASAPEGLYRDGGMLDYHPVPSNFSRFEGLILYPHFYPHLVHGWFDKPYKKRRARAEQLDNVLILAPSEQFLSRLPYQRIPDRKDFNRFQGNDAERERIWSIAIEASRELGECFLEAVNSGTVANLVEQI